MKEMNTFLTPQREVPKQLWEVELRIFLKNLNDYTKREIILVHSREEASKQLVIQVQDKLNHTPDAVRVEGTAAEVDFQTDSGCVYVYGSDPLFLKRERDVTRI